MKARLRPLLKVAAAAMACASFAVSQPALAWGKTGHRISGAIADRHLSGQARAKIALLLESESLTDASLWADEMRSDPSVFWQTTASPWHYVTVPGTRYLDAHAPLEGDAVTALRCFEQVLLDARTPADQKRLALRFMLHIIGDLHQPLHAGKPGDRGGNNVEVTFFGRPSNLHAVWDSGMIDQEQLSYSEYTERLVRLTSNKDIIAWWSPDPLVWISESTQIRDRIYPADPKLSYDYVHQNKPMMEQRLQQAGVRTAAYLNELFRRAPAAE